MKLNFKNVPILIISGCLVFSSYYTCLAMAVIIYGVPLDSIFMFYPSDFGNYGMNSYGAPFYNLGTILAGIFLIPFGLGLSKWKRENKKSRIFLILGQVSCCGAGVGLILGGSFSNDPSSADIHYQAAIAVFLFLFLTFLFLTISFWKHPKMSKILLLYSICVIVMDIIFAIVQTPILEWITVFLGMLYVLLFSLLTWKKHVESFSTMRKTTMRSSRRRVGVKHVVAIAIILFLVRESVLMGSYMEVSFGKITDVDVDDWDVVIDFTLEFDNPSLLPIYVTRGRYRLYIDGDYIGTGEIGRIFLTLGVSKVAIRQRIESLGVITIAKIVAAVAGLTTITIRLRFTEVTFGALSFGLDFSTYIDYG